MPFRLLGGRLEPMTTTGAILAALAVGSFVLGALTAVYLMER